MTYRGHIKGGRITLDEPAALPEGAAVSVQLLEESSSKPTDGASDRREILRMPVEERRQLLTRQAGRLAEHYAADADREGWQGGNIVE